MKKILLASTATTALVYALPIQAQECTATPSCADMGYTKTASQCSGKVFTRCPFDLTAYSCADNTPTCEELGYSDSRVNCPNNFVVCPTNSNNVRCVNGPNIGDLKYSLRTDDHDGWLLCDGREYDMESYPRLYYALKSSFGRNLPNYQGYFLKGAKKSWGNFSVMEPETLPNIKGQFAFHPHIARDGRGNPFTYDHSGALLKAAAGDTGSKRAEGGVSYGSGFNYAADKIVLDASAYQVYTEENKICETDTNGAEVCRYSPYIEGAKVNPENYPANIFIYAGKMNGEGTYGACEGMGYLASPPPGTSCSTKKVGSDTCYYNCSDVDPQDAWMDYCYSKFPNVAYGDISNQKYQDSTGWCNRGSEYYENCLEYYGDQYYSEDIEENDPLFAIYETCREKNEGYGFVKSCTLSEQCMSEDYGISL